MTEFCLRISYCRILFDNNKLIRILENLKYVRALRKEKKTQKSKLNQQKSIQRRIGSSFEHIDGYQELSDWFNLKRNKRARIILG